MSLFHCLEQTVRHVTLAMSRIRTLSRHEEIIKRFEGLFFGEVTGITSDDGLIP